MRLTGKTSDGTYFVKSNGLYGGSVGAYTTQSRTPEMITKLGELEDFMEEQGFESLEELKEQLARYKNAEEQLANGELSDGYHTFNELYEFRKLYNALLFNEWARNEEIEVYKSKRHYDNEECFGGGWFIVVAMLPSGQISNHYELKDWELFNIPEYEKSKYEFDGYTPKDVRVRMLTFLRNESCRILKCENATKRKALKENQALKARWEKLKEWVKNKMETCPNEEWYDFEEMFCEMQELEE